MSKLSAKTDFPQPSFEVWAEMVAKGLRGASFETLNKKTEDDLSRGPLMRAQDLPNAPLFVGRTDLPLLEGRDWHICAPVRDSDPADANSQLLEDLKGGASAVRFEAGVKLNSVSALKRLLEGVYTDLVPIQFADRILSFELYKELEKLEQFRPAVLWTGLDPIEQPEISKAALDIAPKKWRLFSLDPIKVHESGGTAVQELAALAAALAEAMRTLGPVTIPQQLVINLSADTDTHLNIAKFRAARRIIRRISEAFDTDGTKIPITAVTSLRMMQTEDAWTNLLRIMSAGTGAVIGGADMVTIRPFTDSLGQATPFAHRISRNMQLMMMEECQLGLVADPAHGSYWHERMSEDLAQGAWRQFQEMEANGGWLSYISSGALEADLAESKTERDAKNLPILGVNLHPTQAFKAPNVKS